MRLNYSLAAMALRSGRRKVSNPEIIEPTHALELDLRAIYLAVVRRWGQGVSHVVLPAYASAIAVRRPQMQIGAGEKAEIHFDAAPSDDLRNAIQSVADQVETGAEAAVESWVKRTEGWQRKRWTSSAKTATGVDVGPLLDVSDAEEELKLALQRNIGLIRNLSADMRGRIEQPIWDGLIQQSPVSKIAPQLTEALGIGQSRAVLIAGDQTAKLGADLNQIRQKQAGIDSYTWRTRIDDRVRPTHQANNGKRFTWEEPPATTGHPGNEVNCFPAETLVQLCDVATKAYRRLYCGELAEIITNSGKTLRGTPNHPILTPQGWVAIGALKEGDYIFEVAGEGFGRAEKNQDACWVASIGDVFEAFEKRFPLQPVGGCRADFHGDGAEGDIDIIDAAGCLTIDWQAEIAEPLQNFTLAHAEETRSSYSSFDQLGQPHRPSAHSVVGGGSECLPLGLRHSAHAEQISRGNVADLHASLDQTGPDSRSVDPKRAGKRQFAFAGEIASDDRANVNVCPEIWGTPAPSSICPNASSAQMAHKSAFADSNAQRCGLQRDAGIHQVARVLDTRRIEFSGHVYNLETMSGSYIAGGIFVHNCRCVAEPYIDLEAVVTEALRAGEEVPLYPGAQEALATAKLAATAQAKAVVKAAAEAEAALKAEVKKAIAKAKAEAAAAKKAATEAKAEAKAIAPQRPPTPAFEPRNQPGANLVVIDTENAIEAPFGVLFGKPSSQVIDAFKAMVADAGEGYAMRVSSSGGRKGVKSYAHVTFTRGGESSVEIQRTFETRGFDAASGVKVEHVYFETAVKRSGIASEVLRTSMGVYQKLGVSEITVHANIDVGGYTWAKFGFTQSRPEWTKFRRKLLEKLRRSEGLTVAEKASGERILAKKDPRALWELSDEAFGKKLLLGSDWHGSLRLNDPVAMERYTRYVTRQRRTA